MTKKELVQLKQQIKEAEQELLPRTINLEKIIGSIIIILIIFLFFALLFVQLTIPKETIGSDIEMSDMDLLLTQEPKQKKKKKKKVKKETVQSKSSTSQPTESNIEPETTLAVISDPIPSNHVSNYAYEYKIYQDCMHNENAQMFYQDWLNWYGEESAMQMCLITHAESGWRWTVVGVSGDVGFFQINPYVHCGKIGEVNGSSNCIERLKDPMTNVNVARQIYEASNWYPWYGRKKISNGQVLYYRDRLTV